MIDTVRFQIPISNAEYISIKSKAIETTKFDNSTNQQIFSISNVDAPLGSFTRKIHIFIPESNVCFIELSIPKFINGHNVFLISYKEFLVGVQKLWEKLDDYFGSFPVKEKWEIQRLDLCYAWKLKSQHDAEMVADILKNFDFPAKKKYVYDTSVMYQGATYSLKFYLKYDEFFRHDFKDLKKYGDTLDFAYKVLDISRGVIRFEATLRQKYLAYHFGKKDIYLIDINSDILYKELKLLFQKYLKGFNMAYQDKKEIKERLFVEFGPQKGAQLWKFYVFYLHEGEDGVKDVYAYSTKRQYIRELIQAGVSLSFEDLNQLKFKLDIPSDDVVNDFLPTPGREEA